MRHSYFLPRLSALIVIGITLWFIVDLIRVSISSTVSRKRHKDRIRLSEDVLEQIESFFSDSAERLITLFGSDYILYFLVGRQWRHGTAVASDRRVYLKGKYLYKESGHLKKSVQERTIDLADIIGTGYTNYNPRYLLVLSLISLALLVAGVIFSTLPSANNWVDNSSNSTARALSLLSVLIIFFWVFLVALRFYITKRGRFFEISFVGGTAAFKVTLYNKEELDEFQSQLSISKDAAVDSARPSVQQPPSSKLGIADELRKYAELLKQGVLSQEEFDKVKLKLLSEEG